MSRIEPTPRTTVRRHPERGTYDRETIHAVIDAAPICHVGIVLDGQPFVIPMIHCRIDETIYLHGSHGSRLLHALGGGGPACVSFTLLDGLVLARSALHHSMNYRSVTLLGAGRHVTDEAEKQRAFEALVEHVVPGRWAEIRWPSEQESRATALVALPITEVSAKVRTGGVKEDRWPGDETIWAGQVPLATIALPPLTEPNVPAEMPLPGSVRGFLEKTTARNGRDC